jgi:hypothetical protein
MGSAETTRLIFAQAQVEYEDVRIEKDQWPALKESKLKESFALLLLLLLL